MLTIVYIYTKQKVAAKATSMETYSAVSPKNNLEGNEAKKIIVSIARYQNEQEHNNGDD